MLTQADQNRLERIKNLYVNWVQTGDDGLVTDCVDLLVDCDDPQGVWEANIEWSEELTGIPCPDDCRDITKTVRIKEKLKRLN